MLSKKLTFSLTSLVMLFMFGFAVIPVMAHSTGAVHDHAELGPVPLPVLSVIDELDEVAKKADRKNQVTLYPVNATAQPTAVASVDTHAKIRTLIFPNGTLTENLTLYLRLHEGYAVLHRQTDGTVSNASQAAATDESEDYLLHPHDLMVTFLNREGVAIEDTDGLVSADTVIEPLNTTFPDGQNFKITIAAADIPATATNAARYMEVAIGAMAFQNVDPRATFRTIGEWNAPSRLPKADDPFAVVDEKTTGMGDAATAEAIPLKLYLINADETAPDVVSMVRTVTATSGRPDAATSQFGGDPVSGEFQVKVTFTEEPKLTLNNADDPTQGYKLDSLPFRVDNAKITAIAKGTPFYVKPAYREGDYEAGTSTPPNDNVPDTTGSDRAYHPYLLTIDPTLEGDADVMIFLNGFSDLVIPGMVYQPPNNASRRNTRSMLRVPVLSTAVKAPGPAGTITTEATKANREGLRANEVFVPGEGIIPGGGYLVLASGADEATSGVKDVGSAKYKDDDKRERADNQTNIDFKYNTEYGQAFPEDLELFFRNGGTVTLLYEDAPDSLVKASNTTGYHGARVAADEGIVAGAVVISEIMWGTNGADGVVDQQWIELHNTTGTDISIDPNEWVLRFDGATPTLASVFDDVVLDTVSNAPDADTYWEVPGSNARPASADGTTAATILTSMFRKIDGATVPDGTKPDSWMMSPSRPVINLSGGPIGTPGAATPYTAPGPPETPPETPPAKAPVASVGDLMITEIMVDTGSNGNLPQWIEITNVSGAAVRLMGWSINVDNDPSDADVLPSLNIQLGDVTVGVGAKGEAQSVLVISKETNRNSGVGTGDTDAAAGMIRSERIINAELDPHAFLSKMSFRIGLVPPAPQTSGAVGRGDVAGNLQQGWELPMAEGNARSSLIRRDMNDKGEVMGTDAAGWVLASTTSHVALVPYVTYYGDAKDQGSPGIYKAGSALPVELSKFGAKRDPLTGQVVITWETQSELNNAGFFIKRSQQKNTQFVAVNPTMIPGAGTTSEKQSYTYTDTTAQPNIVYYYQIEDVSLDGNRQTLTRAHRLKGHIGAAGKATTTWGELKTSRQQ